MSGELAAIIFVGLVIIVPGVVMLILDHLKGER